MWRHQLTLTLVILLSACGVSASGYHFRYTPACAEAYRNFLALRSDEGHAALERAFREDPANLLAVYIEDYDDFFLLLLNGDPADLQARKDRLDARIRLLDSGDPRDPYYRLCKSGIYLHWAVIHGRFGDYFRAAFLFRKSYLLIRENRKLFPDFAPNNVFYGLVEAIVGTIPEDYKWLAAMMGVRDGHVNRGIGRILSYINSSPSRDAFLRAEAVVTWCYLKFYLQSQKEIVWKYINSNQFPTRDNLLHALVKANLALNYRKAEAAQQTLLEAQPLPGYGNFPVIDYELGTALYLQLDHNCISYLRRYISQYKGKLYIKDAWQKVALSWYLQGQEEKAVYSREQILRSGNKLADSDRQAQRFAEGKNWPHPGLLKAQLLCDGGNYHKALETLQTLDKMGSAMKVDSTEYHFRLGRIYEELGEESLALTHYRHTINTGRNRKEHFAARAALQMGVIYEHQGNKKEAAAHFRECLSMRGHDFQSVIDQQARAGLNRIGQ
jgi:predicted negative regulator of RcsB-dependent stress response